MRRTVIDAPERVDDYLRAAFAQGRIAGGPINRRPHIGSLDDGRAFAVLDVYEPTAAWPVNRPDDRPRAVRKDVWGRWLVALLAVMAVVTLVLAVIVLSMFVSWVATHFALLLGMGVIVVVAVVLLTGSGVVHCPGCPR